MDFNKMNKWMELAKKFQQGSFWDDVLENVSTKELMEQLSNSPGNKPSKIEFPSVDIYKRNQDLIVVIDLPGVRKEDIEISVADYTLHVKGVSNRNHCNLAHIHKERFSGEFERTVTLPEAVRPGAKISAKYEYGTVEIIIPCTPTTIGKIVIE
ncbi:Hsp20/alpha crystallin family protein [Paenibacillus thermotolerans]|uniref:Hsp20/alpha crystallin family protein n=1 Tax=Paenibacillus thermotolerans TaxID=3027807 RepID=UPI0023678260|nr:MULTISPECIES: Hsp20/alpha crystallin family protein [unclassified Paenibacillus]